jgi:hypothetical protein
VSRGEARDAGETDIDWGDIKFDPGYDYEIDAEFVKDPDHEHRRRC